MKTREQGLEDLCYKLNDLINEQDYVTNEKNKIWIFTTIIAFIGGLAIGWFFL